jgi:hypothetical protein
LRDRIVLEGFRKREVPVAVVTAGGYALDTKDTAEIHYNTARECLRALGQLRQPAQPPAASNAATATAEKAPDDTQPPSS